MQLQPYLFFNGRCDEAIEFYRDAVGAEVKMLMRFSESPDPAAHAAGDKVMHAELRIGGAALLLSDGHCSGSLDFQGFALSLTPASNAEAERVFRALGEGGKVQMPLGKTFFSSSFGMVFDRFGVLWMVYVG